MSKLDKEGLDGAALAGLVADIGQGDLLPRLHYLVIIRHGRLVLEENFHNWRPGNCIPSVGDQELHLGPGRHRHLPGRVQGSGREGTRLLP